MLSARPEFTTVAEVNPPALPDMSHLLLEGAWSHVLVTDNVFGRIRVSPFAYAARVTHDVPAVYPTVVVSTRDRNILAIESEVRGAVGNGVDSFLAVVGDTLPTVDHYADHLEIVRHLRHPAVGPTAIRDRHADSIPILAKAAAHRGRGPVSGGRPRSRLCVGRAVGRRAGSPA